ncbi:MAG TPA: dihydroorotate dehydrogenase [Thermoplasmata archaeon]|nr:dihydroorotate dehydrogenase [Thermoplasmata archaeon]
MTDLAVRVAGLSLRNPLLLASGIWGETGDSLAGAWRAGAGGVITKSIGDAPRPGYPNPTVEALGRWGFLNAMGLPNPGIDEYPVEIARARDAGATIIGSVFAPTPETFAALAGRLAETGVVAIELNLSCPHAEGVGSEVGSDPSAVEAITRAVVRAQRLPVIAKLTPNTHDIGELAAAAERGGAAAVSAINTVRGMAIDLDLRRPVLSHGLGGLSGPAIKPVGIACVYQIFDRVRIPIIGAGGVMSADDVIEYALAGARAVEIGTAVAFDGIDVFSRIRDALGPRLEALGFARFEDAIGAAHPARAGPPRPPRAPRRRPKRGAT